MKMRLRRLVPLWVTALSAAGCITAFRQPEVRLDSVRLGGLSVRGGTIYAQVVVVNPNGYALRSVAMSYALDLSDPAATANNGWVPVANSSIDRELVVQGHDSTTVEVPVEFTYTGVSSAIRSVLDKGTLDYRLSGRCTSPGRSTAPCRSAGAARCRW